MPQNEERLRRMGHLYKQRQEQPAPAQHFYSNGSINQLAGADAAGSAGSDMDYVVRTLRNRRRQMKPWRWMARPGRRPPRLHDGQATMATIH